MHLRSIAIVGLLLGILFKTLHWPGANIILLPGAFLTAVASALLLVRGSGPMTIHVRRPGALFAAMTVVLFGVLFKMMHWPGASILLLVGMLSCAAGILFLGAGKRIVAQTPQ
jgi:hypothetical protein